MSDSDKRPINNMLLAAGATCAVPRFGLILTITIAVTCLFTTIGSACNIPVFRYALERWQPDACEIVIFHDQPLTVSDKEMVEKLQSKTVANGGLANVEITLVPVGRLRTSSEDNAINEELVTLFSQLDEPALPHAIVRTKVGGKRHVNHRHGPLRELDSEHLFRSPARDELSRRLMAGHSVVWLMLNSSSEQANAKAKQQLTADLKELASTVALPEGVGLPGSELHSEVPLVVRFSLLEIDPEDPRESYLAELLSGFYPDAVRNGEPLLVPVFGRGRALEVIPADDLDSNLTRDLTLFLAGACSCQVKEQNPGFDLLIAADWDTELFGTDGIRPPPAKTVGDRSQRPLLLSIPPGRNN